MQAIILRGGRASSSCAALASQSEVVWMVQNKRPRPGNFLRGQEVDVVVVHERSQGPQMPSVPRMDRDAPRTLAPWSSSSGSAPGCNRHASKAPEPLFGDAAKEVVVRQEAPLASLLPSYLDGDDPLLACDLDLSRHSTSAPRNPRHTAARLRLLFGRGARMRAPGEAALDGAARRPHGPQVARGPPVSPSNQPMSGLLTNPAPKRLRLLSASAAPCATGKGGRHRTSPPGHLDTRARGLPTTVRAARCSGARPAPGAHQRAPRSSPACAKPTPPATSRTPPRRPERASRAGPIARPIARRPRRALRLGARARAWHT